MCKSVSPAAGGTSGVKTIYMRSAADGSVFREYTDSGSGYSASHTYAHLNGGHLASYKPASGGWKYSFRDHLGTLRVRSNSSGGGITRHDYYPFGGEHMPPATSQNYKFTPQLRSGQAGQERDAETGSVLTARKVSTQPGSARRRPPVGKSASIRAIAPQVPALP